MIGIKIQKIHMVVYFVIYLNRRICGRVVSVLDSRPKAPGSILGGVTSRVSLSNLRSPLCGKVTVQVRRPWEGTFSRRSRVQGE